MKTISLRLPESYHNELRSLAKREKISVNQLISAAVGEKLSALETEEFFATRAENASRKDFLSALKSVPDVEPLPGDELPRK